MMRFSLRELLYYVVIASIALALTQAPFLAGCGLLVLAIMIANLVLPVRIWRFLAYGALIGIFAAVIGIQVYTNVIIQGPRTYNDGRIDAIFASRAYLVQLGALIGATVGYLLSKRPSPTVT